MAAIVILFQFASATVWLHSELRSIVQDPSSKIQYLANKQGNINSVQSSSCGVTSACLVNIPSDISVFADQSFQGLAPMASSPLSGNNLNLAGNLVPTVNGASHSGYIVQLVFNNDATCSDFTKLSQINTHPIYESCTKFVTDDRTGVSYYTSTDLKVASNGINVATDHYCSDASCSTCIYGTSWNMPTNCAPINNTGLFSYYTPIVRSTGLTVTGFNQSTPAASSTVAAPTPTSVLSAGIEEHDFQFFSVLAMFLPTLL